MSEVTFNLHPAQLEIFESDARFKVVAAGRRFGKSYLSAVMLILEGLKEENSHGYSLKGKDVYYVAPTFQQGKDIMWGLLKELGGDVITQTYENTGMATLINGRRIHIKGSDRPDTLRGVGLSFVVLDEYASMRPEVWEQILRPTLADVKGDALFIGTPAGKNHFYDLFVEADKDNEWETFSYLSTDNPFLDAKEIESARNTMSQQSFKQEFEASFQSFGGNIFQEEYIKVEEDNDRAYDGTWFISVDLAGFADVAGNLNAKLKRLDRTSISCVKVGTNGWYVDDIITGRWGIRETSLQILRACQKYRPTCVGIEKGALKNAVDPYLRDQMKRLGIYPNIVETTHGSQKKVDRITWALQGRLQNGRIKFNNGPYLKELRDELIDFPNPMSHDDMIDSLAYIDQIALVNYSGHEQGYEDEWEPLDSYAGI